MAGDLNRVSLIGRLTRDPELKYTQSGTSIANLSIANNRNYTTSSGEKREEVSFFDCVAWGKLGEVIVEYCKKGSRIALDGRLQQRRWEDQNGGKRSKVEIIIDNMQFIDTKASAEQFAAVESSRPSVDTPQNNAPSIDEPPQEGNPFSDNDIPF